ncbi:hypothetical protein [Ensifer sp. 4252]|uniref:hypothetical protein n=1 Tax=Ensifer sp. 4252 TaxID=3373915 RepID=UPI003D1E97EA
MVVGASLFRERGVHATMIDGMAARSAQINVFTAVYQGFLKDQFRSRALPIARLR